MFYISTYEGVRHILSHQNIDSKVRALVAGGLASVVGQTIIVPFDVISQHLMMLGSQKVRIVHRILKERYCYIRRYLCEKSKILAKLQNLFYMKRCDNLLVSAGLYHGKC